MAAPLSRLHQGRAAFSDPFLVVWKFIRGQNPSKTFSTIREQRFAATECLRMDRKIQKWSHKCYAWRKRCMRGSLLSQKHFFFSEGIKKLVQRWKKCIEKQGDYVEKWCYYKFYIFIQIKFVSVVRIIIDSPTYFIIHSVSETWSQVQVKKVMSFLSTPWRRTGKRGRGDEICQFAHSWSRHSMKVSVKIHVLAA